MENSSLTHKVPAIESLLELIETLKGKNGCPWDKEQTPRSMASYATEELYELLDAIESNRTDDICEELGDVLFHVFFIAATFEEMGVFNINDVASGCVEKMTRRHPHVFGNKKIDTADKVKDLWHKIKMKEKNHARNDSIIDSVPARLPALMRAYRISERVAKIGFDWENISEAMKKVEEELSEFKSALTDISPNGNNHKNILLEFGDILFALVNVARFAGIHPETALVDSIKKFEKRFKKLETIVSENKRKIDSLSSDEINQLWKTAKNEVV